MRPFDRLFSTQYMIPSDLRRGAVPGTRSAYAEVIRMALPAVMEMVLMALVSAVDMIMVGRLGASAIASVGLTIQPRMMLLAVFMATSVGVTAIVARRRGEERQDDANRTLRNALVVVIGLSLLVAAVALALAVPVIRLTGAKPDTIVPATAYFRIISAGIPLNALTMIINAAQRGIGNTRVTMRVNVTANLVNVLFNFLLIEGRLGFPEMGVTGAATATVIGFAVGLALSIFSISGRRARYLKISRHDSWRLDRTILSGISRIGGNVLMEQIAIRIGFFLFARIIADLGTAEFATHQIATQFLMITFTLGDGIAVAGTSLVGQSLGRRRPDLSLMYGKIAQRIALTASLTLLGIIIALRVPLFSLFTNDPELIRMGAQILILVAVFQPFQTSSVVLSGCLRGAGDTRFVAVVMMLCVTGIRPAASYAMIHLAGLGLLGAWFAMLFDMILRMVAVYFRFGSGKWFNIRV